MVVKVSIDLDDIDEYDLVEYLEDRGYLVEKENLSSDDSNSAIDTGYNGQAKSVVRYINDNGEETLFKEVLYEYLGMGHFNDVDTLCEELKKEIELMKILKPEVTSWLCPKDWHTLVARAARVCYGSETGKRTAEELCSFLEKRNHLSMFRHGTKYFVFSLDDVSDYLTISRLLFSPYIGLTYKKTKKQRVYFVAMNVQAFMELTPNIHNELDPHEVSLSDFVEKVKQYKHPTAFALIRYTVCVTTQISTSRELNRTSPNNIAEQSTRYVSFGKRGGITICEPHWYSGVSKLKRFTARLGWRIAGLFYSLMMRMGLKAEDARGYLLLDAATRVVYTYNVFEWRHILELRLLGKTGKPHPNAKLVA